MNDVASPAPAQGSGTPIRSRVTDRHHSDRGYVAGNGEELAEIGQAVRSEEAGCKAFVDRGQKQQHHRRTAVDPPVGNRPSLLGGGGPSLPPCRPRDSARGTTFFRTQITTWTGAREIHGSKPPATYVVFVGELGDGGARLRPSVTTRSDTPWQKPALGDRTARSRIRSKRRRIDRLSV